MAWIKRIVTALVGLILLLVLVAFFLPREVAVARDIQIDAPADAIFPHVNSLAATQGWSPWLHKDPSVQLNFTGPEAGVGAHMTWASDHPGVGSGSQEIVASTENRTVQTELDFGDMGTASARFTLEPAGDGTKVTWGFVTDTGFNPMARWTGLMMDGWVGADYEDGLARLKALVETGNAG